MDAVKRMGPRANLGGTEVVFGGWARMAVPLRGLRINEVHTIDTI